jgi:hypothetical protein
VVRVSIRKGDRRKRRSESPERRKRGGKGMEKRTFVLSHIDNTLRATALSSMTRTFSGDGDAAEESTSFPLFAGTVDGGGATAEVNNGEGATTWSIDGGGVGIEARPESSSERLRRRKMGEDEALLAEDEETISRGSVIVAVVPFPTADSYSILPPIRPTS